MLELVDFPQPVTYTCTAASEQFAYRVIKAEPGYPVPKGLLHILVNPGLSRRQVIANLERVIAWLRHGERVQEYYPDTFYCEVEPIPALRLIENGQEKVRKRIAARYPRGKRRLL